MKLSVLIVHYNTPDLLKPMFDALHRATLGIECEVIFIDNASRQDCWPLVQSLWPSVIYQANRENIGFGRANNQALELASGRFVLLLNTDAFVSEEAISRTLSYMESDPRCGVLGVRLVGRDGALQPSCRYFPTPLSIFLWRTGLHRYFPGVRLVDDLEWDHASIRECDWVTGCFYLIRRDVLDEVGLFDPRFFLYSEEVDHCKRVKSAGWKITFFPFGEAIHLGGESAKLEGKTMSGGQISIHQVESELLYFRKHAGLAGVCLHLLLAASANSLELLKSIIRLNGLTGWSRWWRELSLSFGAACRTRLGLRPCR